MSVWRIVMWPVVAAAVLLTGCMDKPALNVNRYALSYTARHNNCRPVGVVIKVRRFDSVAVLRSESLLWRAGRYSRLRAVYASWLAPPSDLVGDLITRDLARSGCYRAVLRYEDADPGDYELAGSLLELYGRPGAAVVSVRIGLIRPLETDTSKRIVFQRTYSHEAKLVKSDPDHLAAALSRAMAVVSKRIQADIYKAVSRRAVSK